LCAAWERTTTPITGTSGKALGELLLGIEPTTGIGDDISTCSRTDTLNILAPRASLSFWIRITLETI
jgi:hypothetical protein